jgi:hypothetical protein
MVIGFQPLIRNLQRGPQEIRSDHRATGKERDREKKSRPELQKSPETGKYRNEYCFRDITHLFLLRKIKTEAASLQMSRADLCLSGALEKASKT